MLLSAGCWTFDSDPVRPQDANADGADATDGDAAGEMEDGDTDDVPGDGEDMDMDEPEAVLCGNGEVDGGEDCDDGNDEDGDGCDNDCTWSCVENLDCDDANVCNGDETCSVDTHTCLAGANRDDGVVCLSDPRRICLEGACMDSECGDGFVDTGGGESCEPPDDGSCGPHCRWLCAGDGDCPDDGNACNGEEYCNLDENECDQRNRLDDGTQCGEEPRKICIAGSCQESICGDGFVDAAAEEECDDGRDGDPDDGCRDDCAFSCHNNAECDDGHDCTQDYCDEETTHTCSNPFSPSETICRPSAGDCDPSEFCDGASPDCPADVLDPSSSVCREPEGLCDLAELCTGTDAACPEDAFKSSEALCRAVAGLCDEPEFCPGEGVLCPEDVFAEEGSTCRASGGACDIVETCSGSSPDCPEDEVAAGEMVCRMALGLCDVVEHCDGFSKACPADDYVDTGIVCRAVVDVCDTTEQCSGVSPDCPDDAFQSPEMECRESEGVCDPAEFCTGEDGYCPENAFLPETEVCRISTGGCDAAEYCTGDSPDCPDDIARIFNYMTPVDAEASSDAGSGWNAAKAIDGSTVTAWYSMTGPPEWIYFDLGDIHCLDGFQVWFNHTYLPMEINIQVSDDALAWTPVEFGWRADDGNRWVEKSLDERTARYLRLYMTMFTLGMGTCTEIQIHASPL